MRSAEAAEQPSLSGSNIKEVPRDNQTSQFPFAWIENFLNALPSKPKNTLWSSKRYFAAKELASPSQENQEVLHKQLAVDLRSFFDEYAAFMPVVRYDYGINGMMNGYSQSMTEIAANHLDDLIEKGMPLERASAELAVAQAVESWMRTPNLPVGERYLAISPRGSKAEGYPGLNQKNYIFINIFEKTETGFALQQYRSYEPNADLPALQKKLRQTTNGRFTPALAAEPIRQDLQVISNLMHISTSASLAEIESILFENKHKWPVKIEKLPQLNAQRYQQELSAVIVFCLQQFDALTTADHETKSMIDQYDLLITTVKEYFIKWVEDHASNYHKELPADYSLKFEEIKSVWEIKAAQEEGQKISGEEKKLLKHFKTVTALNPSLPLRGLTSWAHCITGTPFSATTKLMNLRLNQLSATNILSLNQQSLTEVLSMNEKEKKELQNQLLTLIRIQVGPEGWYVPADYLAEPGCYWDEATKQAFGPCHIPLNQDPLVMTEAEYAAVMAALFAEDLENDPSLSLEEKVFGKQLLKKLQAKLFKASIGLDTLINNDLLDISASLGPTLNQLKHELYESLNPALQLILYLKQLLSNHETETLEALEEECETPITDHSKEVSVFSPASFHSLQAA